MADSDLNYRQRLFVEAYIGEANGNATEAARIAGYAEPHVYGCKVLENHSVQAEVARRIGEAAMSANEVLARLSDQASVDMSDFVDIPEDGEPDSPPKVNLRKAKKAGRTHLVKELKPTKFGIAIKLCDSQAALEKLGKYHRLFTDRMDVTSNGQTIGTVNWDEIETGLIDALAPYPEAQLAVAAYLKRIADGWKSEEAGDPTGPKPVHGRPGSLTGPLAADGTQKPLPTNPPALLPPSGQEHDDGGQGPAHGTV